MTQTPKPPASPLRTKEGHSHTSPGADCKVPADGWSSENSPASPREFWLYQPHNNYSTKPPRLSPYAEHSDYVHVVEMSALTRARADVGRLDREKNALQGAYSSMMFQRDEAQAELATLRAELSLAIGHSNCYCAECNKLTKFMNISRDALRK